TVAITNALIEGVRARSGSGGDGEGLLVQGGAHVTMSASTVERSETFAIVGDGVGTSVALNDVLVESTAPAADGSSGEGLVASSGATVTTEDAAIVTSTEVGVQATGPATTVSLRRSLVEGTRPRAGDDAYGLGVEVFDGVE